jgi:hypothetical protein
MTLLRNLTLSALLLGTVACTDSGGGNPPGTAGTRALDRAAGTNTSGAYPAQSDGMPGNPPGVASSRALDRAAGTNTSGAYPAQSDGMPGNPPGTGASRALNRATTPATR